MDQIEHKHSLFPICSYEIKIKMENYKFRHIDTSGLWLQALSAAPLFLSQSSRTFKLYWHWNNLLSFFSFFFRPFFLFFTHFFCFPLKRLSTNIQTTRTCQRRLHILHNGRQCTVTIYLTTSSATTEEKVVRVIDLALSEPITSCLQKLVQQKTFTPTF